MDEQQMLSEPQPRGSKKGEKREKRVAVKKERTS